MDYKNKVVKYMGTKIRIFFVDKCEDEDGSWLFGKKIGGASPKVIISTKDENGDDMDPKDVELTLRHELFHTILDRLYFEESCNETLVEWLALSTQELNKQGLNI